MKTKKQLMVILCLVLTLVLAVVLCACYNSGEGTPKASVIDSIQPSSDKAQIEKNVSDLVGATLTLPEATYSATVKTIEGIKAYEIAVTDCSVTCVEYFQTAATALIALGWENEDSSLMKTEGASTCYISFMAEGPDVTDFFIYVSKLEADEDGSVSYNYTVNEPTKDEYYLDEELDLTGFSVVKTGSDGSSTVLVRDVDYTLDVSSFDNTLAEGQDQKTCVFPIALIGSDEYSGNIAVTLQRRPTEGFEGVYYRNTSVDYDGEEHTIVLSGPTNTTGYSVRYSVSSDNRETWGEWQADKPSFTDAGYYIVKFEFTKEGFDKSGGEAYVSINELRFENENWYTRIYKFINIEYSGDANDTIPELYEGDSVPDGATIAFNADGSETFNASFPTFTEIGEYTVHYKISKPNYISIFGLYTVTITKKTFDVGLSYSSSKNVYLRYMQGENFFYYNDGDNFNPSILLHPLSELMVLTGTQAGDVMKYSTDNVTWSTTAPTITESVSKVYLKADRNAREESKVVELNFSYYVNTELAFADSGMNVDTIHSYYHRNYSVSQDSGLSPFEPHLEGDSGEDILLARASADNGTTWSDWVILGGTGGRPEFAAAGTYKYEYKLFRKDVGLCEFNATFTIDD